MAILANIVIETSAAIEWALGVLSAWAGQSGAVKYEINREFGINELDAQKLMAIFAGVQSGAISKPEEYDLLQRADVIDGTKTYEEHQAEVDIAALPAPQLAPA